MASLELSPRYWSRKLRTTNSMHKELVASKLSYRVEVFLTGFRWYARGGASGSCQCLLKILIEGSAGFGALCGAEIAKGVAIGLLGTGPILLTSNLSDFINPCSVPFSAGITTPEASALASDSIPTFMAAIITRLIKQSRASQTVLIIQGSQFRAPGVKG
jgi:hypothetical protein